MVRMPPHLNENRGGTPQARMASQSSLHLPQQRLPRAPQLLQTVNVGMMLLQSAPHHLWAPGQSDLIPITPHPALRRTVAVRPHNLMTKSGNGSTGRLYRRSCNEANHNQLCQAQQLRLLQQQQQAALARLQLRPRPRLLFLPLPLLLCTGKATDLHTMDQKLAEMVQTR